MNQRGLGFGVEGLGLRVWGLGFRVEALVSVVNLPTSAVMANVLRQ